MAAIQEELKERRDYIDAVEKVLALLSSEAVRIHGDALRNRRFLHERFTHYDQLSRMEHDRCFGFHCWNAIGPCTTRIFTRHGRLKYADYVEATGAGLVTLSVCRFALQRMCRRLVQRTRLRIQCRKEARALRVFGDPYLPPDLLNIAVAYAGSDEVAVVTPSMERTCFSPTVSANRSLLSSTTH